jgi:hypothetical protein
MIKNNRPSPLVVEVQCYREGLPEKNRKKENPMGLRGYGEIGQELRGSGKKSPTFPQQSQGLVWSL